MTSSLGGSVSRMSTGREQERASRPDADLGDDGADGGLDGLLHVCPEGFAGRGNAFEPVLEPLYRCVRRPALSRRSRQLAPNRSGFQAKPEVLVDLGEPLVVGEAVPGQRGPELVGPLVKEVGDLPGDEVVGVRGRGALGWIDGVGVRGRLRLSRGTSGPARTIWRLCEAWG